MQAFVVGAEDLSSGSACPELSLEEMEQRDQDYRADLDHNQRPSNIIMLRMLPPNASANEVSVCKRSYKALEWFYLALMSLMSL